MKFAILLLAVLTATCSSSAPVPPSAQPVTLVVASPQVHPPAIAREFRAAWVSPVWRPDWPSRAGLSPDSQRAELVAILDDAQAIGLNAIILHVRMAADALYPTAHAPWSSYLTGTIGRAPDPSYDPLQFAVDEAHRRGIALHAWFNPFRAAVPGSRQEPSADHVRRAHPEWIVEYGRQRWIDPGIPTARRHVLDAILDVVDRYDIDGVHLDDYFYPYLEDDGTGRTITFPDSSSWLRYGAGFESRSDWRRANIDDFVATLYREVKARKPAVSVGISPFGIWKSGVPSGISGLNAYSEIFADSRRWLREGWVDYFTPQLYWEIGGNQSRFTRLDEWWREQNVRDRHIWPGLHTERETIGGARWQPGEIAQQIDTLRALRRGSRESLGHVHFRMNAVSTLANQLRSRYAQAALPPAMPWLDDRTPARPYVSPLPPSGSNALLRISAGDSVPVRWYAVQTRAADETWKLSVVRADDDFVLALPAPMPPRVVSVKAISPSGIESEPTVLQRAAE